MGSFVLALCFEMLLDTMVQWTAEKKSLALLDCVCVYAKCVLGSSGRCASLQPHHVISLAESDLAITMLQQFHSDHFMLPFPRKPSRLHIIPPVPPIFQPLGCA